MEENRNEEVMVVETPTDVQGNDEGSSLGALILVGAGALGTVAVIGAVKGVKAIGRKIKTLRKKPDVVDADDVKGVVDYFEEDFCDEPELTAEKVK